uniref:Coiled-coil domain containing 15 n=1 Tax=Chelonoidis abingdonii TaxID=106734 RepID=A0A8C0G1Y5_CHEAB
MVYRSCVLSQKTSVTTIKVNRSLLILWLTESAEASRVLIHSIFFFQLYNGLMKASDPAGSSSGLGTDFQAPLVLWPGIDKEETKKQRQNQYLRYRRLFMDIEREQVKEQQRQKERQKKIAKIKSEKEHQRRAEEQRIQERAYQQDTCSGEKACEVLAQLRLEERRVRKSKEKQQRNKEYMRYMEALRAQMREKIKLYNIDLPPLCCCGSDFWDSHPDTCANNCMFYKNHKGLSSSFLVRNQCRPRTEIRCMSPAIQANVKPGLEFP